MPTPTWIEGFEHGVYSVSGGGISNGTSGTAPTVQGVTKRTGNYAIKFAPATATSAMTKTLPAASYYSISRFYLNVHTKPTNQSELFHTMTAPQAGLAIIASGSGYKLGACCWSAWPTLGTLSAELALDTWYRLDLKVDQSANPATVDFQVDGTPVTQKTWAYAAATFTQIHLGPCDSCTTEIYVDDIVVSATPGDYPIGAGGVVGLSPNAAGTSNPGTNVIEDNTGADVDDSTNPANVELDDVPLSVNTDYIKQVAVGTGNYAEVAFADIAESNIWGAQGFLAYMSSGTSTNQGACIIRDSDGQETPVWGNPTTRADYSESSMFYKSAVVAVPSGGWTQAHVNALKARIGYSNDIDSVPYWENLMVEVAYAEEAATPKSVSDSGAGTDGVSVLVRVPVTDAGVGVDAIAAIKAALTLLESGVGVESATVRALLALAETGVGVDVESVNKLGTSKTVTDSGSGVDVVAAVKAILAVLDLGVGVDTAAVMRPVPVVDVAVGADVVTVKASVPITDVGVGADLVAMLGRILAADTGAGVDAIAAVKAQVPLADAGAGVDGVSVMQLGSSKVVMDVGVGAETLLVKVTVSLSEAAAGADGVVVEVSLTIQDVGAGVDTAAIKGVVFQSEAGVAAEALSVLSKVAMTDAGSALEALAVKALLAIAEAGVAVDGVSVYDTDFSKRLSDLGAGLDTALAKAVISILDSGVGVDKALHVLDDKTFEARFQLALFPVKERVLFDDTTEGEMVIPIFEKYDGEEVRVGFQMFPPALPDGVTILSATCVVSPAGLTLDGVPVVVDGDKVKQMIKGGGTTAGTLYELTFTMILSTTEKRIRKVTVQMMG